MNKPSRSFPRPLSEFLGATLSDSLKTQGFASTEIIARWADIVGTEIAAHSEPMKITWPRANTTGDMDDGDPESATLVLRAGGPAAVELYFRSDEPRGGGNSRRDRLRAAAGPPRGPAAPATAARSGGRRPYRRQPAGDRGRGPAP